MDYPAPDRLAIYRVNQAGRVGYWAVLDDKLLEPVYYPEWALPVLRTYGVQEHRSWPARFPSLEATAHAVSTRTADSVTSRFPPLNLHQMLAEEEFQAEEIPCSVLDLDAVKVPWRFQLAMASISIACILVVGMLPPDFQTIRILIGMIAGTAFGAMASTLFPVLRAARRVVDPLAVYRKFGTKTTRSASVTFHG